MSKAVAFLTKGAAESQGYDLLWSEMKVAVYPSGDVEILDLWTGPDGRTYSCCYNDAQNCFVFWPVRVSCGIFTDPDGYDFEEEPGLEPCYEVDLEEAEE